MFTMPPRPLTQDPAAECPGDPAEDSLHVQQRAAWASGDYGVVGTTLAPVGEALCEAADVRPGERVLDVACGTGNTAFAAARRSAFVVAIDYVPSLVAEAQARAHAERLTVECREGDARALAFPDGTFDVVASVFGVMFVADAERAATELRRVCAPRGRIALAAWTPGGFVGRMFDLVGRHSTGNRRSAPAITPISATPTLAPTPATAVPSPMRWGTEAALDAWFAGAASIEHRREVFRFRYRSVEHWLDVFTRCYGPLRTAIERLGASAHALESDLRALARDGDEGHGRGLVIPAEYLQTVVRF